jgi:hypothetical protein
MKTCTIPLSEKQLLINCPTQELLFERFREAGFEKNYHPTKVYSHVMNMWYNRERHFKEIEDATKSTHTVLIPREIKTKSPETPRTSPFHDDDMQVKIYNQLVYNGQLLKEQLELFRVLAAKGEKND